MGRGFNYSYWRGRLEIPVLSVLPEGRWAPVSDAARILGVSKQTVRVWYLKRKVRVIKYNGIVKVCLDDVDA